MPFYAEPSSAWAFVAGLLVVASAPIALVIIDDAASAFRGPVDGRAEQCAVFWIFVVGLWALVRVRAKDATLLAVWCVLGAVLVVAYDVRLRANGSAFPPPMAFFGMLLVLIIASLHAKVRALLRVWRALRKVGS